MHHRRADARLVGFLSLLFVGIATQQGGCGGGQSASPSEGDARTDTPDGPVDGSGEPGVDSSAGSDAAASDAESDATTHDGDADAEGDAAMHDGEVDDETDGASTDSGKSTDATGELDAAADANSCDLVSQSGCPVADKCALDPVPTCVPDGTVPRGAACSRNSPGDDDCTAGNVCVNDGNQICRQFCAMDSDCTQSAEPSGSTAEPSNVAHCLLELDTSGTMGCTVACNPVNAVGPSGCVPGMACIYASTTDVPEVTDCETTGGLGEGATCVQYTDCASGLTCVASHCREVCRNATPNDCSLPGASCIALSGIESPMFGVCCPAAGC